MRGPLRLTRGPQAAHPSAPSAPYLAGAVLLAREQARGMTLDVWLVALALLLIRLPVLLGQPYAWPVRWLFLSPFVLSMALNLVRMRRQPVARLDGRMGLALAAYLAVLSLSFLRALAVPGLPWPVTASSWMVVVVLASFAMLAFLSAPEPRQQDRLRLAILAGLLAYLLANVVLHAIGIEHSETLYRRAFPASMLGLLGLRTSAVLFPMAGGINAFGTVAGAAAAMSGVVLARRHTDRQVLVLSAAGVMIGILVLILTDARASLMWGLASVLAVTWAWPRRTGRLQVLMLLPFLAPPLLVGVFRAVPATWWEDGWAALRPLLSISNRDVIWGAALNELRAFRPVHLVGFGAFGQLASGLSSTYAGLFSSYVHAGIAGAHNAVLQQVLEAGYLGLGILLATLKLALRRLSGNAGGRAPGLASLPILGLLVFTVLAGTLEASWSPENQELHASLLLALAACAVSPAKTDT